MRKRAEHFMTRPCAHVRDGEKEKESANLRVNVCACMCLKDVSVCSDAAQFMIVDTFG